MGLLNTFEELIIFGSSSGRLLIRMMLEHFSAVSSFDLFLGGTISVAGDAEHGVMILRLVKSQYMSTFVAKKVLPTFQSLASRCNISGSSGSSISSGSSSSTFLTLAEA